jgi:hypothetical protein
MATHCRLTHPLLPTSRGCPPGPAGHYHPDKLRTSQRTRVACQEIAKVLWRDVPETTITDMIDHETIIRFGGGGYYEEKTRRKWLSQVAPPEVRDKRGRPKRKR